MTEICEINKGFETNYISPLRMNKAVKEETKKTIGIVNLRVLGRYSSFTL